MANSTLAYDAQQQVQPVADQPESDGDSGLHDLLVWLVNNGANGLESLWKTGSWGGGDNCVTKCGADIT